MKDANLQRKGQLTDELQLRIRNLKQKNKAAPKEWHEKLATVSETSDDKVVEDVFKWAKDLPAIEYNTEAITWDTVTHFVSHFSDRLVIYSIRHEIINNKKPQEIIDAIKKLDAIYAATRRS